MFYAKPPTFGDKVLYMQRKARQADSGYHLRFATRWLGTLVFATGYKCNLWLLVVCVYKVTVSNVAMALASWMGLWCFFDCHDLKET